MRSSQPSQNQRRQQGPRRPSSPSAGNNRRDRPLLNPSDHAASQQQQQRPPSRVSNNPELYVQKTKQEWIRTAGSEPVLSIALPALDGTNENAGHAFDTFAATSSRDNSPASSRNSSSSNLLNIGTRGAGGADNNYDQQGSRGNHEEQNSSSTSPSSSSSRPGRTCLDRWMKYLVDPRRTCHLLIVHVLVCCFIPGPYFFDSLFGAYKEDLQLAMNINNTKYSLILATGSLSAVLSGPAGFLVRNWGISKSCLLFGSMVCLGSFLLIAAIQYEVYFLSILGRVLFWAGICTTGVVQVVVVFLLFSKKYAAIAQAGVLAACRIGGTMGYILADPLKQYFADPDADIHTNNPAFLKALKFSFVFVCVSGCCYLSFAYLYSGTEISRKIRPLLAASGGGGKYGSDGNGKPGLKDLTALCFIHQALIGLLYTVVFVFEYNGCLTLQRVAGVSESVAGSAIALIPGISVVSLFLAPLLHTFQRLIRFACFAFVLLFIGQGLITLKAYDTEYNDSAAFQYNSADVSWTNNNFFEDNVENSSGSTSSSFFGTTMLSSFQTNSTLTTSSIHNALLQIPPWVCCVILGIGFGCCVVPLWTLVPHVCKNKDLEVLHVGGCYMQQSLWLFFGNIVYGHLVDATGNNYFMSQLFFTVLCVIGLFGVVFIHCKVTRGADRDESNGSSSGDLRLTSDNPEGSTCSTSEHVPRYQPPPGAESVAELLVVPGTAAAAQASTSSNPRGSPSRSSPGTKGISSTNNARTSPSSSSSVTTLSQPPRTNSNADSVSLVAEDEDKNSIAQLSTLSSFALGSDDGKRSVVSSSSPTTSSAEKANRVDEINLNENDEPPADVTMQDTMVAPDFSTNTAAVAYQQDTRVRILEAISLDGCIENRNSAGTSAAGVSSSSAASAGPYQKPSATSNRSTKNSSSSSPQQPKR
ncbi:unnamed protein product [Amoebophrya sp. A120]|nr:unnamed protein product [Amoebophrya sp. A120]|eukprot:GSA120T00010176001.1